MNTQNDNKMDLVNSPHVGGKKMSSSLKERLRRTARSSFTPPVRPATPTPECDVRSRSHIRFVVPSPQKEDGSSSSTSAILTPENDDGVSSFAQFAAPLPESDDGVTSLVQSAAPMPQNDNGVSSLVQCAAHMPESDDRRSFVQSAAPTPSSADEISSLVQAAASAPESDDKVSPLLQPTTPASESDEEISLDMEVTEGTPCGSPSALNENLSYSLEDIQTCDERDRLKQLKIHLMKEIDENEEKLRKLKLVQYYETNTEFQDMLSTVKRWVKAAQEAVQKLYDLMPEPKMKFSEFLQHLQIDHELIKYDSETDSFLEEEEK